MSRVVCARIAGVIASRAVPVSASLSRLVLAMSGTGVAGMALSSVTDPTQSVHSFGASAAKSDRATNDAVTARMIRFMSAGLKGLMLLNPSSGVKLPPEEILALESSAAAAGLEVLRIAPGVDCTAVIRDRINAGRRLFVAAGGARTVNAGIRPP